MAEAPADKTLDRIRKLLAQAEGTTHEHERQTFMEAAQNLMAKYGIERAHLGALHPETDKPGHRNITAPNPWANEQINLIYHVAEALRCKCIVTGTGRGGVEPGVAIMGFESDMERAEMLYTSLLIQMFRGLFTTRVPAGHPSPKRFQRAFLIGFADEAARRIREAEQRAAQQTPTSTGTSTDLVLVSRAEKVEALARQMFPRTRKSKRSVDGLGYLGGQEAGRRADIGGSRLGSGSRTALS
ncbi:DUF2786 domain-containing protein [Nonomuraea sp. NPDC050663]|uniref:DUF2786 domain-containing protein n=1 Tax=Nonomuraea sp. NPDC050663 TaxID=3364370 RepID=UPI0037921272